MCNHQKDVFAISLMDTVYTKREEAGKALLGLLGMAMNRTEPVSIGQYKGFDLQIAYFAMDKMYLAYLVGSGINPVQLGADAVGNTMRLDNCLHNLPQSVTDLESKLMQLQKQLENAKEQLAQPFAQADELAEKSKRLAVLEALLNLNEKDIVPAYSDEGWYVEKTTFSDNRQAAGEQIDKTSYRANYHLHADNALAESQDQVAKGNVEISKIVSSSGQSNGLELENARFTFYLVSDLSKVSQFDQTRTGAYTLQSILDAYINKSYDNAHLKWDFSGETQAIAKTYEVNAAEIAAYNKTLTAAGENKNGNGCPSTSAR